MEVINRYKWTILFPILIFAVVTAGMILYFYTQNQDTAQDHVTLGQQYLSNKDYENAEEELSIAMEADPSDWNTRQMLVDAYTEDGKSDLAEAVLQDAFNDNAPEPAVADRLIELLQSMGNTKAALQLTEMMIQSTDLDTYYEKRQELLSTLNDLPRNYAAGLTQELIIKDGKVESRGNNKAGQLGVPVSADTLQVSDFASAGFDGDASRVYAIGNTSYVLDTAGDLYAAGVNRRGEYGTDYGTLSNSSGWTKVTKDGDCISIAGTAGCLYLLKKDGSVWYTGENGKGGFGLCNVSEAGLHMVTINNITYVLTTSGNLYQNTYGVDDALTFHRRGSDISEFTADSDGNIFMLKTDGELCGSRLPDQAPSNWQTGEDSYIPDFTTEMMAAAQDALLVLDSSGKIYRIGTDDFNVSEIGEKASVLYWDNGYVITEMDDQLYRYDPDTQKFTILM